MEIKSLSHYWLIHDSGLRPQRNSWSNKLSFSTDLITACSAHCWIHCCNNHSKTKQITWIWSNTSTYPSKQELIKISQNSFLTHLGKLNWWGHTVLICKMRENGLSTALGAPESSYYIHNSFERVISLEASQTYNK